MSKKMLIAMAVGLALFVVAGCGGDDSTSSTSAETTAAETTAAETTSEDLSLIHI